MGFQKSVGHPLPSLRTSTVTFTIAENKASVSSRIVATLSRAIGKRIEAPCPSQKPVEARVPIFYRRSA